MPGNPDVCGDSDDDSCDDCAVGSDNFGPLVDRLPASDGLDADSDGGCNAGDLDDDNDGVVDASELANARGGRMLARFDADADGRITREEFNVGLDADFKAMDKNGDGVVTADERPQRPR